MSKYKPLSERLAGHAGDEWRASFAELEEVLGFPLPKAARSSARWWANDPDRPHSRAWTGPGWQVAEVDRTAEAVAFRRNMASADIEAAGGIEPTLATPEELEAPQPIHAGAAEPPPATEAAARKSRLRRAMPAIAAGAAVMGAVATLAARVMIRRQGMRP